MRYYESKLIDRSRDLSYRIFVTDSLKYLPEMKSLQSRWVENIGLIKEDNRSADEIAADVIEKAGLIYGECI